MFGLKKSSHIDENKWVPKESHTVRIIKHLKYVGKHGAWNFELSRESIGGMDWRKCISLLRKEGYNIQHVRTVDGGHKYYLNKEG